MVVIGGVIGLELVCAYAAFGTKITVVEAMDHMLPTLDGDLTKIGVAHMKKMGMAFNLECPVQAVARLWLSRMRRCWWLWAGRRMRIPYGWTHAASNTKRAAFWSMRRWRPTCPVSMPLATV